DTAPRRCPHPWAVAIAHSAGLCPAPVSRRVPSRGRPRSGPVLLHRATRVEPGAVISRNPAGRTACGDHNCAAAARLARPEATWECEPIASERLQRGPQPGPCLSPHADVGSAETNVAS